MELFLYSTLLFLFLESLCDPLYHRPALPSCSHMFLYLAIVFFSNVLSLFYGCSVSLTLLALRVLFSQTFCRGSLRVVHASLLFSSLELCLSPDVGKADSARGLRGSCQSSRALLTGQCWQGRALCDRVIGETSRHTDFPSFLTRTLASGLHVFQSLPHILTRLSAALVSAVPQCHLLCILETHFWSVLMCSLVLSVSIFLVCGLRGR